MNKTFTLLTLTLIILSVSTLSLESDISYYDFNSGAGNTLFDQWGDNDGTNSNSIWNNTDYAIYDIGGDSSQYSGYYNGGSGYRTNLGEFNDLNFGYQNNFSICLWIKPSQSTTNENILTKWGENADNGRLSLGNVANDLRFVLRENDAVRDQITVDLSGKHMTDRWTFGCFVYNASHKEVKAYYNGTFFNKSDNPAIDHDFYVNGVDWYISGRDKVGTTDFYKGLVDDLMFFNRSLSSSEINNIWNYGNYSGKESEEPIEPIEIITYNWYNGTEDTLFKFNHRVRYILNNTINRSCNITLLEDPIIIETIEDNNIELCDNCPDSNIYQISYNKSFSNLTGWDISLSICHEFSTTEASINLSCGSEHYTYIISSTEISSCDIAYVFKNYNFSICKNKDINLTISTNADPSTKSLNFINLSIGQIYDNVTIPLINDNNSSNLTYQVTSFISGIDNSYANCSDGANDNHQINIQTIDPKLIRNKLDTDCYSVIYDLDPENNTYEYCSSDYVFNDIIEYVGITDYYYEVVCNNITIYNQSDNCSCYSLSYNWTLDLDNVTDFRNRNRLNCYHNITISDNINLTDIYYFSIIDSINPYCTGFNNMIVTDTSYNQKAICRDEYIYLLNVSCDNGQEFYTSGIGSDIYNFDEFINVTNITICNYQICDGHTSRYLKRIKPIKIDNKSLKINYIGKSNDIIIMDDSIISYQQYNDRIRFSLHKNKKDIKKDNIYNFKISYKTVNGRYIRDDKYQAWIIDENLKTWFDLESDSVIGYDIDKINDTFLIEIQSRDKDIYFDSIGELNCIEGIFNLTYDNQTLGTYIFQTNKCPIDDTPTAIIFSILMIFALAFLIIGLVMRLGIFTLFSGLMLIFLSFSIYGCSGIIGMFMGLLGLIIFLMGSIRQPLID